MDQNQNNDLQNSREEGIETGNLLLENNLPTNGPETQAQRESPPSSQQYASWTRDQRETYIRVLINEHTQRQTEVANSFSGRAYELQQEVEQLEERLRESRALEELENATLQNMDRDYRLHMYQRVANIRTLGSQGTSSDRTSNRDSTPEASQREPDCWKVLVLT